MDTCKNQLVKMSYQLFFLLILTLQKTSYCCPNEFYQATETTCLYLAQPTTVVPQEAFCDQKGGKLFGRPLTDDLKVGLKDMLKEISEDWMPPEAYVGMERTNRMEYGNDDETWIFVDDESDPFHESNFTSWFSEPKSDEDCAVVGLEYGFKAQPVYCYHSYTLLCEKNEYPCESSTSMYTSYDGYCLVVVKDLKAYDNAKDGCAEGHLMWMKNTSCMEQIAQAFYNSKYFGGVYVGLKKEDGKWIYDNGEEEPDVYTAYDDHEFKCGAVRIMGDMSLKIYSHPCFAERLWFLCETSVDNA